MTNQDKYVKRRAISVSPKRCQDCGADKVDGYCFFCEPTIRVTRERDEDGIEPGGERD